MKKPQSAEPRPFSQLEERIGYTFSDKSFLRHALTHPSASNEVPHGQPPRPHYEQLEFLGDAVLSFTVAEFLYRHFPNAPEGILSSARKSVVEQKALQGYARKIDLGDFIAFGKGAQNLRSNASTLENAFEALVGALYSDAGIKRTRNFILSFTEQDLLHLVPALLRAGGVTDCKTRLQQFIQEDAHHPDLAYQITDRVGPDHAPTFTAQVTLDGNVVGTGQGCSKKLAEEQAARQALQYFKLEPDET